MRALIGPRVELNKMPPSSWEPIVAAVARTPPPGKSGPYHCLKTELEKCWQRPASAGATPSLPPGRVDSQSKYAGDYPATGSSPGPVSNPQADAPTGSGILVSPQGGLCLQWRRIGVVDPT